MSRTFDSDNTAQPAGMALLVANVPACFDRESWQSYLTECWRATRDEAGERRRLERGEAPDFCRDCLAEHRARRLAENRCNPPAGATPPEMEPADATT